MGSVWILLCGWLFAYPERHKVDEGSQCACNIWYVLDRNLFQLLPTKNDSNIFIYESLKNLWKVTYLWQWYSHILLLSNLFFFTSLSLQLSVMLCHNFYFIAHFLCLFFLLLMLFSLKALFKQTPSYHKTTYMNIIRDLMLWEKRKKEILSMKWQEKLQEKKLYIYKSFTNLSSFSCYKKHNFCM